MSAYKAGIRHFIEQMLLKFEENNDQIYALEHRVKYLEQECDIKDSHIEKITSAMQDAVDDCRLEAEEMLEEMGQKVSVEIEQRRDAELIILRLQAENCRLKDTLRLQLLPGIEQSLDAVIENAQERGALAYEAEIADLRHMVQASAEELAQLKQQREAEMTATISVVCAAQQKIEFLHHQLKAHIMARDAEAETKRHTPNNCDKPVGQTDNSGERHLKDAAKAIVPHRKRGGRNRSRGSKQSGRGSSGSAGQPGSAQSTPLSALSGKGEGDGEGLKEFDRSDDALTPQSLSSDMSQAGGGGGSSIKQTTTGRSSGGGRLSEEGSALVEKSTSFWSALKLSG
ncbi:unnamed protein product [Symbiodinium microadriaticum]|nr:unnamed protein product [Symbiodinium microadriaticum]